jgi:hypothetical protein
MGAVAPLRDRTTAHPDATPDHDRAPDHDVDDAIDLDLVAHIVRRAGLDCRVDEGSPSSTVLRARKPARDPAPWTVAAGTCLSSPLTPLAFVGPTGSTRTRLLRDPDERRLAALIVLQALRDDPHELLTHEEASASGLAGNLVWA